MMSQQILHDAIAETDLRGLDYLDEKRAARYAGVSVSQFRANAARHGILCVRPMGKKVYRKTDIQRMMEREWQRLESSTDAKRAGTVQA